MKKTPKKILIVSGKWVKDDEIPRPSKLIQKMSKAILQRNTALWTVFDLKNGGYYTDLYDIYCTIPQYDFVLWMPELSNDLTDIEYVALPIKTKFNKTILVRSSFNSEPESLKTYDILIKILPSNTQWPYGFVMYSPDNTVYYNGHSIDDLAHTLIPVLEKMSNLNAEKRAEINKNNKGD